MFLPKRSLSGRIIFFRKAERRFNEDIGHQWGDFSGYGGTDGDYEYRLPKVPRSEVDRNRIVCCECDKRNHAKKFCVCANR